MQHQITQLNMDEHLDDSISELLKISDTRVLMLIPSPDDNKLLARPLTSGELRALDEYYRKTDTKTNNAQAQVQ